MVVEQRVIGQKIGARPAAPPPQAPEPEPVEVPARSRGAKKAVLAVVGAVVALALAAAWFFLLGPGAGDEGATPTPEPTPQPVPGEVLTVGPVSVNLADRHYLRLGFGLQLTDAVAEPPDPARALDLAIALYSGRSVDEVTAPAAREQLKAQLLDELVEAYDGEVMDVYLTDYVTQ